ncbi:host-nuclease inhibitor Gam family protein, partial [Candidatus Pacearchaeota archaeon]|nr:host-nuclease inhibitor Gam family protein [Candidatus Pacearchaeota archaeon]
RQMERNRELAQVEYARLQRERDKVDAWLAKANAAEDQTIEYMSAKLEPWIKTAIEGRKKRSIDLPFGRAGFKATPGRMEYKDAVAVVAYAEARTPSIVEIKKSVPKAAMKKLIEATGEVPDCVELIDGEDKFYVETKEE